MKDMCIVGAKTHDCHILMQQFLPIGIRGIMHPRVRKTITQLCLLFNKLCGKVFDVKSLDKIEEEAVLILCKLEMLFPPSFFDIMVHLIVHIVREIRICGPVYLRWMYPIERYMKILKGYVKNQRHPKISIVQRYIAEESIEFCSERLLGDNDVVGISDDIISLNEFGEGSPQNNYVAKDRDLVLLAHWYILSNSSDVAPYIETHKEILRKDNDAESLLWVMNEQKTSFADWFNEHILYGDVEASDTVRSLAHLPSFNVRVYNKYEVNGFCFSPKVRDDSGTMQNSGVMVVAMGSHFATTSDSNPLEDEDTYFGVIDEIWELCYVNLRVPLFKCQWVKNGSGVQYDEGFTLVNLSKHGYVDDPFVMPGQVRQVFYVDDPAKKGWSVVLPGKTQAQKDELQGSNLFFHYPAKKGWSDISDFAKDDVYATHDDHNYGHN